MTNEIKQTHGQQRLLEGCQIVDQDGSWYNIGHNVALYQREVWHALKPGSTHHVFFEMSGLGAKVVGAKVAGATVAGGGITVIGDGLGFV